MLIFWSMKFHNRTDANAYRINNMILTFSTKNVQLFYLFLTDSLLFTRTMSRSRKETCWAHFNWKRKLKFLFLPKISFWSARASTKKSIVSYELLLSSVFSSFHGQKLDSHFFTSKVASYHENIFFKDWEVILGGSKPRKILKLWNHQMPQLKWHNLRHILMYQKNIW